MTVCVPQLADVGSGVPRRCLGKWCSSAEAIDFPDGLPGSYGRLQALAQPADEMLLCLCDPDDSSPPFVADHTAWEPVQSRSCSAGFDPSRGSADCLHATELRGSLSEGLVALPGPLA